MNESDKFKYLNIVYEKLNANDKSIYTMDDYINRIDSQLKMTSFEINDFINKLAYNLQCELSNKNKQILESNSHSESMEIEEIEEIEMIFFPYLYDNKPEKIFDYKFDRFKLFSTNPFGIYSHKRRKICHNIIIGSLLIVSILLLTAILLLKFLQQLIDTYKFFNDNKNFLIFIITLSIMYLVIFSGLIKTICIQYHDHEIRKNNSELWEIEKKFNYVISPSNLLKIEECLSKYVAYNIGINIEDISHNIIYQDNNNSVPFEDFYSDYHYEDTIYCSNNKLEDWYFFQFGDLYSSKEKEHSKNSLCNTSISSCNKFLSPKK